MEETNFLAENPLVLLVIAVAVLILIVMGTIRFLKFLLNSTNDKPKDHS